MGIDAVIRVATSGDIHTLEGLRRAATEERAGPMADPGFADRFREWHQREQGRRVFWIATVDSMPVGMTNLVVFRRMPRPGRDTGGWGYLGNAYVMRSHRNQGIGRRLLRAVIEYADTQGLERIVLNPTDRAIPFYQRAGFLPAVRLLAREAGLQPTVPQSPA
jgi:GNAT superfamily N-acetyltransferase